MFLECRRIKLPRPQTSSGSEPEPSAPSRTNYGQDLVLSYQVVFRAKEAVLEANNIKEYIDNIVIDGLKRMIVTGVLIDYVYLEVNARRDFLNQSKRWQNYGLLGLLPSNTSLYFRSFKCSSL